MEAREHLLVEEHGPSGSKRPSNLHETSMGVSRQLHRTMQPISRLGGCARTSRTLREEGCRKVFGRGLRRQTTATNPKALGHEGIPESVGAH